MNLADKLKIWEYFKKNIRSI